MPGGMMRLLRWMATAICLVMTLSSLSYAQGEQGRFAGTVRDSTGAFVPGVTVTARNERTGDVRTAVTNAQGYFVIAPLKPSDYTLSAELAGFAKIEYTKMPIAAGQELALDFEMKPAGVTEAVTVVGTS